MICVEIRSGEVAPSFFDGTASLEPSWTVFRKPAAGIKFLETDMLMKHLGKVRLVDRAAAKG